jgi:hypothetical protein
MLKKSDNEQFSCIFRRRHTILHGTIKGLIFIVKHTMDIRKTLHEQQHVVNHIEISRIHACNSKNERIMPTEVF